MSELNQQARDLLRRFPLIDGHNDLPWTLRARAGGDANQVRFAAPGQTPGDPAEVNLPAPGDGVHTDLRGRAAGWAGAFLWSFFVPPPLASAGAVTAVLEQIDVSRRMIAS